MSKTSIGEDWCQSHLADQRLYQLLEKVDGDLVQEARDQGCRHCQGKLYRSDYARKPRGGPLWEVRFSLCRGREGCRRRNTPPSVRSLGRRGYAGLVVVLVSAMRHGLKPERVRRLRQALGMDRRTLMPRHAIKVSLAMSAGYARSGAENTGTSGKPRERRCK